MKPFEKAELEVLYFSNEDIITTSTYNSNYDTEDVDD